MPNTARTSPQTATTSDNSTFGTGSPLPSRFGTSANDGKAEVIDRRSLRNLFSQLSKIFRDSEGGGAPIERFEEVSKLLFCKTYAERTSREAEWTDAASCSDSQVYRYVSTLMEEASRKYPEVFRGRFAKISTDIRAVSQAARLLGEIRFQKIDQDIKGSAYEEMVRGTFDKSDHQQFFTPRVIVDFMVEIARPRPGMVVCDPACGTGGFLIGVLNHLNKCSAVGSFKQSPTVRLIGAEIDPRMAWVAQMNLLMHGEDSPTVHLSPRGGSLSSDEVVDGALMKGKVDLILTNPPFGSDFSDPVSLSKYILGKGRASRRRGVLFVERCLRLVRPGGLVCIVLDEGVLNSSVNEDVRELLLHEAVTEAVISLPEVTFMPYATVKASVLVVRRRDNALTQGTVFMAEPEHVGHRPNGDPLYADSLEGDTEPTLRNDLPKVLDVWRKHAQHGVAPAAEFTPAAFVVPPERFAQGTAKANGHRFDTRYHHPSRYVAERALERSPYRTPSLGELVVERNFSVIPVEEMPDQLCRYVGLANIEPRTGRFYVSNVRGKNLKSTVRLFRAGDILFSKLRPELRKIVLVPHGEEEGYVSSECLVLRSLMDTSEEDRLPTGLFSEPSHGPEVDTVYLAHILRSDIVYGQLVYQVTGVGRPRLERAAILDVRIPLPPLDIQRRLVGACEEALRQFVDYRGRSQEALKQAQQALSSGHDSLVKQICP